MGDASGDPADEAAAELVLALRRAVTCGVTVARETGGYRVVSAHGELALTVFDDGSTSDLYVTSARRMPHAFPTPQNAAFWDPSLLRATRQGGDR